MKVLLIAPYQGLAETAKKMNTSDDIQLDVTVANLEEAIHIAQLAEKQGYDLIISRGGTATMIQDVVLLPVVHINITGYDMLRVFTLIRGIKKGVALVGYANISQGAATMCNILEFDVKMITIESRDEVKGHLERLKELGFTVVIGDVVTVQVAEQVGLRGVLITSGKEAVMDALEEGKRVFHFFRRVNHQLYYFQETFHSIPFPIVLLHKDGTVLEKNLMFEQDTKNHNILLSSLLPGVINKVIENETNQWAEIDDDKYTHEILAFPVDKIDGIVGITIHSSIIKTNTKAVTIIGNPVHIPIIGESDFAVNLRKSIQNNAQTDEIVCISGEKGTGKFAVAQEIHFERYGQEAPIILIRGNYLSNDGSEIDHVRKKLAMIKRGTIIVKDIESATTEVQVTLQSILAEIRNILKVIILVTEPQSTFEYNGVFDGGVYENESKHFLHIIPLRERKEDIGAFVDYFLSDFHVANGIETVGMKPDAVDYLMQFDWRENLVGLKKVIKKLGMMTTVNYIELSHVKKLMDNDEWNNKSNESISLEGTLQEIEQKVIRQVLHEEGNNQSKTAERLGINRSTLWRKLKQ